MHSPRCWAFVIAAALVAASCGWAEDTVSVEGATDIAAGWRDRYPVSMTGAPQGRPVMLSASVGPRRLHDIGTPRLVQPDQHNQTPRPYIYGCGITWGNWLGLDTEAAKRFDRVSMDRIKEMGGTNVPANFAWIDIEPRPGEFHWEYVDHQVEEARKRGLEIFAYTGLTPDWALPPEAPKTPGIGYRFPPDGKYADDFSRFFETLARRYRGRVKYYEFWNEPNGCSWINDNCANGHMAHTYVPWLKRWYTAMKAGDPDCVLAVGGLDYHSGVKEGWKYVEDIYKHGGGPYFDAVAIHPYGKPLHWKAIKDTYRVLVRHGDGHKRLWLNEYGWNTRDERKKADYLHEVLSKLASPEYHMVFQANYLVITDLPDTRDDTGHDYGLCSRDRKAGTITPRASYEAFRDLPKAWQSASKSENPTPEALRGDVPAGMMLWFAAPGVDPGEPGDDQGPPRAIRREFVRKTAANVGTFGIGWGDTQREAPTDAGDGFDFTRVRPSEETLKQKFVICNLHFFGNPWAEEFRFSDIPRYNRHLENWAEAACRYAREQFGVTIFATGGNERDLVAPDTYKPHYPDWHFFYMDPIKAIHRGMKRAHPDNKLMIGNLCYSDRDHIGALYCADAKDHFEILAIHAYGPRGCHLDMEQVIESRQEMVYRGDEDIPIVLTEGWSCFPLPESIDRDPIWRKSGREYTPQEIEHYRQTVLDGWRNLITPRPGEYDPAWVGGARYFVLNDHWGGRGWAKRAKPDYDENGKLKGFHLDGYWIGTSDPEYVNPFLRPWGLIDINGRAKGDTIEAFPPYIPKHRFSITLSETLPTVGYDPRHEERTCPEVAAGTTYHATLEFTNLEDAPLRQCHFRVSEKSGADFPGGYAFAWANGVLDVFTDSSATRKVRARRTGPELPATIAPGETVRTRYEVTFSPELARLRDDGKRERIRPYADLYFVWNRRPYHTDAWLPRVAVRSEKPDKKERTDP